MSSLLEQTKAVSRCDACLSKCASILKDYIPTFRFGVLSTPQAISISINPAENQEGFSTLALLSDYGVADRSNLSDNNVADIARQNDEYFLASKHRFFGTLAGLASSIDPAWSYEAGTLCHVDVVACVTRPVWGLVPIEERQVMREGCRQHFIDTLRLASPDAWLLCDGKTVLDVIRNLGGQEEETKSASSGLTVSRGTLVIATTRYRFLGWNRPAHRLNASPSVVASAAKHLMTGSSSNPQSPATVNARPTHPPCIPVGQTFTKQRDLMQFIVNVLGHNKNAVCRDYAAAERLNLIPRRKNEHKLLAEQYASRLYDDGIRKKWL